MFQGNWTLLLMECQQTPLPSPILCFKIQTPACELKLLMLEILCEKKLEKWTDTLRYAMVFLVIGKKMPI
jgi:hypothetical protein